MIGGFDLACMERIQTLQSRSIGQRIRLMRDRQNWSQARLAQELDRYGIKVNISSINRWENDKVVPGPYYRDLLCQVFHIDAEELFGFPSVEREAPLPAAPEKKARPIWNIPYLRNRYFTGREGLLGHLHGILTSQKRGIITALCGLGGIGKTQVAVEYAYRHVDEYEAVLWVRADTLQTLNADFLRLAELLNLPDKAEADPQGVTAAVIDWLHTHKCWLLILDNADDLQQVIKFLPRCGEGHTVLTTRAYATGSSIKGIELDALELEEGALLTLRRAKLLNEEQGLAQVPERERRNAEHIADLLGGLPLALDQAGAYIEENQCCLAEYLSLYRKRAMDLLKRRGHMSPLFYPHTVATTWNPSFAHLEQSHPGAADLLRLCAFLSPDSISESLLLAGCARLEPVLSSLATDPLAWNEAIGALRGHSLIRRVRETKVVSVHRLVKTVLKATMDDEAHKKWTERAAQIISTPLSYPEKEFAFY